MSCPRHFFLSPSLFFFSFFFFSPPEVFPNHPAEKTLGGVRVRSSLEGKKVGDGYSVGMSHICFSQPINHTTSNAHRPPLPSQFAAHACRMQWNRWFFCSIGAFFLPPTSYTVSPPLILPSNPIEWVRKKNASAGPGASRLNRRNAKRGGASTEDSTKRRLRFSSLESGRGNYIITIVTSTYRTYRTLGQPLKKKEGQLTVGTHVMIPS